MAKKKIEKTEQDSNDSVRTNDEAAKPDNAKVQPKPVMLRSTDNLPLNDENGIKINYRFNPDGTVEILDGYGH